MRVRFTKKDGGKNILTIIRDNGTVSRGHLVPGMGETAVPHDVLHALVEKTLGFTRGVYGMVNAGFEIEALLAPEQKKKNAGEKELQQSEAVTGLLQAERAYTLDEKDFRSQLAEFCARCKTLVPEISDASLKTMRVLRDEYAKKWTELPVDATMEIDIG